MILDIRKTETRLAPRIPTKGYYVDLTWERLADAKQVRREYTVGPFPEYARELFVEFVNLLGEVCLREGGASRYHEVPGYGKWFGQKPGDTPLGLVIETPHDDLDRDFEYELTGHWEYYCDGTSASPQYVEVLGLHPSDEGGTADVLVPAEHAAIPLRAFRIRHCIHGNTRSGPVRGSAGPVHRNEDDVQLPAHERRGRAIYHPLAQRHGNQLVQAPGTDEYLQQTRIRP